MRKFDFWKTDWLLGVAAAVAMLPSSRCRFGNER